jgi:hypothetical protein
MEYGNGGDRWMGGCLAAIAVVGLLVGLAAVLLMSLPG